MRGSSSGSSSEALSSHGPTSTAPPPAPRFTSGRGTASESAGSSGDEPPASPAGVPRMPAAAGLSASACCERPSTMAPSR